MQKTNCILRAKNIYRIVISMDFVNYILQKWLWLTLQTISRAFMMNGIMSLGWLLNSRLLLYLGSRICSSDLIWLKDGSLTLNVRGPSYHGLTRSISWLLMAWLLTSPGHQQPWYWLCRIGRCLSYLKKDLNYLRRINVEKWHKM